MCWSYHDILTIHVIIIYTTHLKMLLFCCHHWSQQATLCIVQRTWTPPALRLQIWEWSQDPRGLLFLGSIWCCSSQARNHPSTPQEDLAKFGYRPDTKVEIFLRILFSFFLATCWEPVVKILIIINYFFEVSIGTCDMILRLIIWISKTFSSDFFLIKLKPSPV